MKRIHTVVLLLLTMAVPGIAQNAMMMSAESVVEFTTLEAAQSLAVKGPTVLFFHAQWCPLCRADLKMIEAQRSRLGDISVVVVDYDKNRQLKAKYGIVYQHTYVQIGEDAQKLAIWNGGGLDAILENVIRPKAH